MAIGLGLITFVAHLASSASAWALTGQASDAAPVVVPTTSASNTTAAGEACFPVEAIEVEGATTILPADEIVNVVKAHAASCQGNQSVGDLLTALNGLFAQHGYVTTQAYLPEQDIAASKTIRVNVVPGRIDRIVYHEDRDRWQWLWPRITDHAAGMSEAEGTADLLKRTRALVEALDDDLDRFTILSPDTRIALAGTVRSGDVLHVDPLQDTLDALNRVPSHRAKAELKPGSKPATSDIHINNRIDDAFRLYAGYDTESVQGIDRLRFGVSIEKDNLIGINDIWSLTLRSGTETNELSGSVQVPLGNVTFRGAADWQESVTILSPVSELFTTTWNVSGGADWTFLRTGNERAVLDVTLSHRGQDRYINGLELTGQDVTALSTGVGYTRSFDNGSLGGRLGMAAGLPIFNADKDSDDQDDATPRNQFFKLEGALTGTYVVPQKMSLSSTLSGQWAGTPLLSDDQLTIGSRQSVRGYSGASFKADRGLVWRNEATFAVVANDLVPGTSPSGDWVRGILSRLNPYLFVDGGVGQDIANDIVGHRLSTGVGLRYGGPALSFDVGYALRLSEDEQAFADDVPGELFVNLRLKVF